MTNYYVRETPDGADVLNRISVTISALVCTCYEVSTAQQIANALNAQAPPAAMPTNVRECLACGSPHLDTGWECTDCGYDNQPRYDRAALAAKGVE